MHAELETIRIFNWMNTVDSNYENSKELAQGQSRCVKIFNHYNVVNGRTRKNHNKYTRPPTLEPNTTFYIGAGIQSNNLISHLLSTGCLAI